MVHFAGPRWQIKFLKEGAKLSFDTIFTSEKSESLGIDLVFAHAFYFHAKYTI